MNIAFFLLIRIMRFKNGFFDLTPMQCAASALADQCFLKISQKQPTKAEKQPKEKQRHLHLWTCQKKPKAATPLGDPLYVILLFN